MGRSNVFQQEQSTLSKQPEPKISIIPEVDFVKASESIQKLLTLAENAYKLENLEYDEERFNKSYNINKLKTQKKSAGKSK